MTPQERELIERLFERLRGAAFTERDAEAEALIRQRVAEQPYAPYAMAQALVVQDEALRRAEARLRELEQKLAAREASLSQPVGGRFGDGPAYPAPPAGADRPAGAAYDPRAASPSGVPNVGARSGGGFLATAASVAAGVAGGALLADGLRSLFGGTAESLATADTAHAADNAGNDSGGSLFDRWFGGNDQDKGANDKGADDKGADDKGADDRNAEGQDAADQADVREASYDDGHDDGGGDDGGFDGGDFGGDGGGGDWT